MRLPYREGDIFALPLGDGTTAPAQIVACGHHTVDVVVRCGDTALPPVRVSDRALVLKRWRPHQHASVCDPGAAHGDYWVGAARFERMMATRLGVAELELPPLVVRRGMPAARRNVHRLRLSGHGAIELVGARIDRIEELAMLPYVRALRIARVDRFDLASLREVRVAALSLESIADLRGVETLLHRADLRQLEILDQWASSLDEMMPLVELPNLVRAEIDIGGRRKNIELNRRATWAYPWPLEIIAESDAL